MADFSERVTRKNTNNETSLPLTISSKDGLVDQVTYFNKTVASKDMSGYYLLKEGEYAYNKSYSVGYDFGSIKRLDRYPMGALSTLYICFSLKRHDSDFIRAYFDSLKWYREIYMISAEGARNHGLLNVPTDEFFQTVHYIPQDASEQRKIADFLIALDRRIAAQQSLVDNLKKYKRGLLQDMFPQKGEAVPKLRLAGFIGAWEQRKVSELFRVTRGYVLASSQTDTIKTDEMPYPVYSSQTKDKGLMGYYKDYLYEDAITWTTDGANAGTVNYRAGKFYCTNVCGVLLSNEVKANQMIAEALNNVAKGYVSYVGNPKLMNNVMADIVIHIPTKAEERELLSSLFSNLDNLITLHQRRLDTLMQCKNGMLQQLFI